MKTLLDSIIEETGFELESEFSPGEYEDEFFEQALLNVENDEWEGEVNRKSKAYIKWLQGQLNRLESARLSRDGVIGSKTRRVIKAFQKKYSVIHPPDGKPSETLDAFMIMFGAPPPPGSPEPKPFNPRDLPSDVYTAFKKGPGAWKIVLQRALDAGIKNVDRLADIMFFLAHPERKGRQINSGESTAVREWNNWRDKIRPILDARKAARARVYPSEVPKEMIEWLEKPVRGVMTRRFRSANRKKFRFLIAWKSEKPKFGCGSGSQPADRSWFAAARDDLAYWRKFTESQREASIVADAKRTYNEKIAWYMLEKKLCANAARRVLRKDDKKWLLQLATLAYGAIPVASRPSALKSLVGLVDKSAAMIQWLKERS